MESFDSRHVRVTGSQEERARKAHRGSVCALLVVVVLAAGGQGSTADASVFQNSVRWPTGADGYTIIPVCLDPANSVEQAGSGGAASDPNPSLDHVVGQVRDALRENWEAHSSVRFVGWQVCTPREPRDHIRLRIHPDATNASGLGNPDTNGSPTVTPIDVRGTSFKPWGTGGHDDQCIRFNSGRAVLEYHFSCPREFAVHEFGHAIGFAHEWRHPDVPRTCANAIRDPNGVLLGEGPLNPQVAATTYQAGFEYTIPNLHAGFDKDSIMTYLNSGHSGSVTWDDGGTCADVDGERFGSPVLDEWDQRGVAAVYPPVAQPDPDVSVGVIPDSSGACPEPTEVTIHLDNEDGNNHNDRSGWIGAITSDQNTTLVFCKVRGSQLGRLPAPDDPNASATYAVLKLGATCPPESTEFVRFHDDEDDRTTSWMAGEVGPTQQNESGTSTALHWCLFEEIPASETSNNVMINFPRLDFGYGVAAPPNFAKRVTTVRSGSLHIDDEDTDNQNRLDLLDDPRSFFTVHTLMFGQNDTTINLALVSAVAPQAKIRVDSVPTQVPTQFNPEGWYTGTITVTWNWTSGGADLDVGHCTAQSVTSEEGAPVVLTATCVDVDGRVGTASIALNNDSTPPTITAARTTEPNFFGWYNHPVTVHFTCDDATSGVATQETPCPGDYLFSEEGRLQRSSLDLTVRDRAHNIGIVSNFVTVNIDLTPPTITARAITQPNDAGWYRDDVQVAFSCHDGLSGVAPLTGCPPTYLVSNEGISTVPAQTARDVAANESAPTAPLTIKIDKTPPVASVPASRTVSATGPAGATVTYEAGAQDNLLRPIFPVCAPASGARFPIGTTTVTCRATDAAGNSAAKQFPVTVLGAAGQLAALLTSATGIGPGKSLAREVKRIQLAVANGRTAKACTRLEDFVKLVKKHVAKGKLTKAQAASLTTQANNIMATMRC